MSLLGEGLPGAVRLTWHVNLTLPVTSTWQIHYAGPPGDNPSPITGLPEHTRAYTLTGLTDYEWYLISVEGGPGLVSDTIQVMPSGLRLFLPVAGG